GAGRVARRSPAWLARLLRRADERRSDHGLPAPHDRALVQGSPASQPENPPEPVMGSDEADRRTLLALSTHPAPVARTTVPRHYPRQEPGALAALAGICAGGGERSPSLPRPVLSDLPAEPCREA